MRIEVSPYPVCPPGQIRRVQVDQLLRIAYRQRAQQDRVHHTEYGRVRPNSKRKRYCNDGSEARSLPQLPHRITQRLQDLFDETRHLGHLVKEV